MSIYIKHILIESRDKESLAHFLSHVLEMEALANNGEIDLIHPHFKLKLSDRSGNGEERPSLSTINFNFDNFDSFDELKNKIEFYLYRNKEKMKEDLSSITINYSSPLNSSSLVVKDFDGREWVFSST